MTAEKFLTRWLNKIGTYNKYPIMGNTFDDL